MAEIPQRSGARVILAAGARAAERRVLAEIEAALPAGALPPLPVRVVVPSHPLREHLLARLADRRAAWLGLEVTTLAAAAHAILERTGGAPPSGAWLEGIFAARLAARESALARSLGGLARGFDEVRGAVDDLLSAGFLDTHLAAVEERLSAERGSAGRPAVARARALARVAAGVRRELAARGLAADADLFLEATRRLQEDPDRALPARAVLVHGFADATGVASDLIEALVRHAGARVVIDVPPGAAGGPGAWRFGRRLIERLRGAVPLETAEAIAPPVVERLRAADPPREARAAVAWLAADAASRARPERAAIVARDLAPDLGRLVAACDRQALPRSAASGLPAARAALVARVLTLLERRADTPLGVVLALARERLLEVSGHRAGDLGLACALAGALTLGAAARLETEEQSLPVPDRLTTDPQSGRPHVERRRVGAPALAAARSLFAQLLEDAELLAREAPLAEATTRLAHLLATALPASTADPLVAALSPLATAGDLTVEPDELARLAAAVWRPLTEEAVGAGAGAALLSVTEARGLTFDRLALVGLTRDRFPRTIRPDPLLPDALRARMRDLLPDLPIKAEGHDEERFLFAQLLAAAERVALLRPLVDADGRPAPPSPLLDELARAGGAVERPAPDPTTPAALELAVAAALAHGSAELAAPLQAAVEESRARFGSAPTPPARVVAARLAVLAEHGADPAGRPRDDLGPFLGRVGRAGGTDPRAASPSVTALERLAGCGWRLFLERVLRLAPLPDLAETLPSLPGRLAGTLVHRVLERLLAGHLPGQRLPLEAALAAEAVPCRWPAPGRLERTTRDLARALLAREGLDVAAFEPTLVRQALDRLEVARAFEWATGARELLGVEAGGTAEIPLSGVVRRVAFVVDRIEVEGDQVVLTDYKTGRPMSGGKRAATRLRHLLAGVARGEWLQLPVYLRGVGGRPARARYLQLAPDLDDRAREIALGSAGLATAGDTAALSTLFAVWDEGAFVPRLVEWNLRQTFGACSSCDVREACLQGDSGARLRLARWAERTATGDAFDAAARAWWNLQRTPTKEDSQP